MVLLLLQLLLVLLVGPAAAQSNEQKAARYSELGTGFRHKFHALPPGSPQRPEASAAAFGAFQEAAALAPRDVKHWSDGIAALQVIH